MQFRQQWQNRHWEQALGITAQELPGDRMLSLADWQQRLEPQQLTARQEKQLTALSAEFQRLQVSVELEAVPHDRYAAIWMPMQRRIRLNPRLLRSPDALLQSLHHESVHVAQSCRSSLLWGYSPRPLGLPIDPEMRDRVDRSALYQNYPGDRRVEYEAHTYARRPAQVIQLLQKVCP